MGIEIDWLNRAEDVTVIYNNTTGAVYSVFGWGDVRQFFKQRELNRDDYLNMDDLDTLEERFEQSLTDYLKEEKRKC